MHEKRNIFVSGSTRGLGLAFTKRLAARGHNVFMTDISEKASAVYGEANSSNEIIKGLSQYGGEYHFSACNLLNDHDAKKTVHLAWETFGHIDVVIANAGGDIQGNDSDAAGSKPAVNNSQISVKQHKQIFERNYQTCWNTVTPFVPLMSDRGLGKIITISSVNASFGMPTETAYSTAKAAVIQLTRAIASECRENGVAANCLMLGPTRTGRFKSTLEGRSSHDLEALNSIGRLTRVAEPDDAADVMEFLVEEKSDYISGQIIRVDGGRFPQPV